MTETEDFVRTQTFPVTGPVDIDIGVSLGRVEIRLAEDAEPGDAHVEVRHAPGDAAPWAEGVSSVLDWVTERFGDQFGPDLRGTPGEAIRQCRIELTGDRLVIRAPKALPLRNIPLIFTVHAPARSRLEIRAGAAEVSVSGTCGRADVGTGGGDVTLARADGPATIRTGSGAVRMGPAASGLQVRTGSGDVEVSEPSGSATVGTGTGTIWLGAVAGDALVRSGSGDVTVREATAGTLELITGSGAIRIGIGKGTIAKLDVSSGSGRVSSELTVADTAPDGEVALTVRARTGSGDAVVTSAAR